MNNRTPTPKICFCGCRRARLKGIHRGNSERSSGESDTGAVRSRGGWCSGWSNNPRETSLVLWSREADGQRAIPAEESDERLGGFQVDQARGKPRISAPALPSGPAAQRQGPVPWTLPDSPRQRSRRLPRKYGPQCLSLLCVRRGRNGLGLRGGHGALFTVRGRRKAEDHYNLPWSIGTGAKREESGYGKKKGFFAAALFVARH